MIILNGKKFAETEEEMENSLFESGGTCVGYAKRLQRQVKLFNHQKALIGVINGHGVLCSASKIDGKNWYSFCTIKEIGEYKSYMQSVEEPEKLAVKREFNPSKSCYNLYFK